METNIAHSRLRDQVEEAILNAINNGEFPIGTKLPSERVLMEMFGVGRPSIKEALLMLEQKGFLRLRRGIAPVVIAPTPERAMASISDMVTAMVSQEARWQEFYDLRIMLETFAVIQLANLPRNEFIDGLKEALNNCANDIDDPEAFRQSDIAFHKLLLEFSDNKVAIALHGALIEWGLFKPETGHALENIHQRVLGQHRNIVDAIIAGNADVAAKCLTQHLTHQKSDQ